MTLKLLVKLIFGISLLGIVGYGLYQNNQNASLRADNKHLDRELKISNARNDILSESVQEEAVRARKLNNNLASARQETSKLQDLYNKHNLGRLMEEKPGLITKRMQAGTQKTFDDIQLLINGQVLGVGDE